MKDYILFTAVSLVTATATAQTTNTTEEATLPKDQIIVSATRIDTPIEQIGSSVSVITAEEIERQHAKDAQSAIKLTPGVQMTQRGGPGTASSVFIRGANANQSLVLINGIRVNSNTTGASNLSTIPTDAIERIEVLRGPQSALYGADAIGGVINIVTKKGENQKTGGSVLVEMGTKGYVNTVGQLSGGNETVDFSASASFLGLNEYDIASDYGGTEDDPYERRSLFTDLGLNFASDGRADLVLMYNELDTSLDEKKSDVQNKSVETEFWLASLDVHKPIMDIYEQNITFGYNEEQNTGLDSGTQSYYFETRNYDFNAQADLFVLENDTINIGYDFRYSEAENDGSYTTKDRTQNSVYLNNQWNLDEKLFITLGGRYDDYSDVDSKGTWQSTASWFISEHSRLHGSIGTGYKAPTFNDLYWPFSSFSWVSGGTTNISESVGNPNLKPEESFSFDIGLEQSFFNKTVIADVTYFQNEIDDMIEWADVSTSTSTNPLFSFYTPSNVNKAEIKGLETSLTFNPADSFSTRLYYTYTDAKDADTGKWLARRARHNAGISANWNYSKKGSIFGDLTYTGKRYDNATNTDELEAYELINIGTRYAITDSLSIVANINNLLDKYYETARGYGTVGRVFSAGVSATF
jgi:vitamin B12 transporter